MILVDAQVRRYDVDFETVLIILVVDIFGANFGILFGTFWHSGDHFVVSNPDCLASFLASF